MRHSCERCGAERCDSCAWLDDMCQACDFLAEIAAGTTREAFVGDIGAVANAKYHVTRHLCLGAGHQSAEVRARFPGVDWRKLDRWATIDSLDAMEQAGPGFTEEEYLAVNNPALKSGAFRRTSFWDIQPFPASMGALGRQTLHRQSRALHTA